MDGGLCERCKQQHNARASSRTLRERLITASTGELFLSVARRVLMIVCCARPRRRRRRRRRPRRRRSAVRPPPTSTANQDVARPVLLSVRAQWFDKRGTSMVGGGNGRRVPAKEKGRERGTAGARRSMEGCAKSGRGRRCGGVHREGETEKGVGDGDGAKGTEGRETDGGWGRGWRT